MQVVTTLVRNGPDHWQFYSRGRRLWIIRSVHGVITAPDWHPVPQVACFFFLVLPEIWAHITTRTSIICGTNTTGRTCVTEDQIQRRSLRGVWVGSLTY